MIFENVYFITGNAYAGKSTMVKRLAERYDGIACEENYHDILLNGLDSEKFPCLTYTRDLKDWHEFIRRTPEEYEVWIEGVSKECEILEIRLLNDLRKLGLEEYRKRGFAKELLAYCEEWALNKKCTEFASDCEIDNEISLQFHLAMGFKVANLIICFNKKLIND